MEFVCAAIEKVPDRYKLEGALQPSASETVGIEIS